MFNLAGFTFWVSSRNWLLTQTDVPAGSAICAQRGGSSVLGREMMTSLMTVTFSPAFNRVTISLLIWAFARTVTVPRTFSLTTAGSLSPNGAINGALTAVGLVLGATAGFAAGLGAGFLVVGAAGEIGRAHV